MRPLTVAFLASFFACLVFGQTYTISTFAGGGLPVNIPGTSASIGRVAGIAVDAAGNVFIASLTGHVVLRLDAATGVLTLAAGNGIEGFSGDGGPAGSAQLSPSGIAVDSAGNLYIADTSPSPFPDPSNRRIRKVSKGVITTVVEGVFPGLTPPNAVAVDSSGNLYIADGDARILKVANTVVTTVAGNGTPGFSGDGGPAASAQLADPVGGVVHRGIIAATPMGGVAVDSAGNLYVADPGNNRIRQVSHGVITTVAGDGTRGFGGDNGPALRAQLNQPIGVAVDSDGNLYVADTGNNRIRKVSNGVITTVAGDGTVGLGGDNGPATSAQMCSPNEVVVDTADNLYIADGLCQRDTPEHIREVSNGMITTVAGDESGFGAIAELDPPVGIAVDSTGDNLYISVEGSSIRKFSTEKFGAGPVPFGLITRIAGGDTVFADNGPATSTTLDGAFGVAVDSAGNVYVAESGTKRIRLLAPPAPRASIR
jgi:trimeric autotransporter adhesin